MFHLFEQFDKNQTCFGEGWSPWLKDVEEGLTVAETFARFKIKPGHFVTAIVTKPAA